MKAIVLTERGRLEMQEVPRPEPRPGQVRVRTAACGICATDLEMIAGDDRVTRPAVLGHEWAGYVDAAGSPGDVGLVGKPCVAENVLPGGGEVGFEHPGGYGEFLVTEAANVHVVPDNLPMPVAALVVAHRERVQPRHPPVDQRQHVAGVRCAEDLMPAADDVDR